MSEQKTFVLRLTEEEFDLLSDAILLARLECKNRIWAAQGNPNSEYAVLTGKEAKETITKLKFLHKTVWNAQIDFNREGTSDGGN